MPVQVYTQHDRDMPFETFLQATYEWWKWAVAMPNGLKVHPLSDPTGKNALGGQPTTNVVHLGGTWSSDEGGVGSTGFTRTITGISTNTAILLPAVNSGISPEKHPNQFHSLDEALKDPQDIMNRAVAIIDEADASISVRHGQDPTQWFQKENLERVKPQEVWELDVSPGIFANYPVPSGVKRIHFACDGYWLFIKPPLEKGEYTIGINGNAPKFDGYHGEIFRTNVTYDLVVS